MIKNRLLTCSRRRIGKSKPASTSHLIPDWIRTWVMILVKTD